jgi:hypothetical protein
MPKKRQITPADILPISEYAKIRLDRRREIVARKKNRRVEVGPHATFYFESYETMWLQIQEMLYIEKGGQEQLQGELEAYNPLIPQGSELVATVMFEIDDPVRRKNILGRIGGIEETAFLSIDGEIITARPEADLDRTNAEGKASSVQFLHFDFSPEQISLFRATTGEVILGFKHPGYAHMTLLPESVRQALAHDFS